MMPDRRRRRRCQSWHLCRGVHALQDDEDTVRPCGEHQFLQLAKLGAQLRELPLGLRFFESPVLSGIDSVELKRPISLDARRVSHLAWSSLHLAILAACPRGAMHAVCHVGPMARIARAARRVTSLKQHSAPLDLGSNLPNLPNFRGTRKCTNEDGCQSGRGQASRQGQGGQFSRW